MRVTCDLRAVSDRVGTEGRRVRALSEWGNGDTGPGTYGSPSAEGTEHMKTCELVETLQVQAVVTKPRPSQKVECWGRG